MSITQVAHLVNISHPNLQVCSVSRFSRFQLLLYPTEDRKRQSGFASGGHLKFGYKDAKWPSKLFSIYMNGCVVYAE